MGIDAMKVYGGGDLLNAEEFPVREGHDAGAVYRIRPDAAGRGFRDGRMQDAGRDPGRTRLVRRIARRKGLCLRNGRHGAVYLGRALHVLRPLPPPVRPGIDIATVHKFHNLAVAQGEIPETVREHYAALTHHASECIGCGACETRCPFGVEIVASMRRAAERFGY